MVWWNRSQTALWLGDRGEDWLGKVRYATLDLSATYKAVFDATVPNAVQVADPFHVVKHATFQLDQCRRRVQQELLGHRGRKGDPLFGPGDCWSRPTNVWTSGATRS